MVTSKETRAAIIALHQNGLTCKEIATKNIAPERTIYRIVKNFKETDLIDESHEQKDMEEKEQKEKDRNFKIGEKSTQTK
ncbi:hypothetical protein cypCar_00043621, partial [Cyprinus carpio]